MGLVDRLRMALGRPEPAGSRETMPPPRRPRTHTLVPGEDLAAVAAAHGVTEAELVALNRLADPTLVYAGQVLRLRPP